MNFWRRATRSGLSGMRRGHAFSSPPRRTRRTRSSKLFLLSSESSLVESSRALSYDDGGWTQELVADRVAFLQDVEHDPVLRRVIDRSSSHSFVACRIERMADRREPRDAERAEFGKKLIAHELDAFQHRIGRPSGRVTTGRNGTIEVVEHVEQLREHRALRALDLARDVAAHARLHLIEFFGRVPPIAQRRLKLSRLVGDAPLELFDVGRLAETFVLGCLIAVGPRPPAPVDDAHRNLFASIGRIRHAFILSRYRGGSRRPAHSTFSDLPARTLPRVGVMEQERNTSELGLGKGDEGDGR